MIIKWLILLGAIFFTMGSTDPRHSGVGTTAAGLWIAFAILHANQKADTTGKRSD